MNTNKMTQEQISALVDGELADSHVEMALAALRHPEDKQAWDTYHHIGDAIRSEDTATQLSPDFSARLMARLDAEPPLVAPVLEAQRRSETVSQAQPQSAAAKSSQKLKRFALPGAIAAAAAAALAVISGPQMMVAENAPASSPASSYAMAKSASSARVSHASIIAVAAPQASAASSAVTGNPADAEVLRDPNIDEYLMAHQRFSPSVYSTAQFARSSLNANEADK